jgi:hypothetical protein
MNWEAIGAIGEIIAAAAVVFSFVYLAAQIRQNTQQVEEQCRTQRQNGLLGARSAFTEWRSLVIQDATVAAIWKKGSASLELLNEEERVRMDFLLIDFFWAHATIWLQMSEGMADERKRIVRIPIHGHDSAEPGCSTNSDSHRSSFDTLRVTKRAVARPRRVFRESGVATLGLCSCISPTQ